MSEGHAGKVALVGAECEESLALRYLQSSLEQAGFRTLLIPFNSADDTEQAAEILARSGAGLAGFSMVFTYRAREFAELARRARERGYRGYLVAGGHFAAFNADALLRDEPAFDAVAIGEGERLMVELARHRDDPARVAGLVWRGADGAPRHNAPAVKPADLERLPPPMHRQPPDTFLGLPIANVLTSRGCAYRCMFCSISAWHRLCGGARVRMRSPEAVAEEIAGLFRQGYRLFNFHDDNFFPRDSGAARTRVHALRDALRQRGVRGIGFAVKSRPCSVEPGLFSDLKAMGLYRVFLGIEAGCDRALRQLGRRQTVAQNEAALRALNALDLHVCYNLLLLNPDSTLEDFRANVAFLKLHPDNPLNFCRTEVYAGTPLERKLRREGRLDGDYWGYGYRIADPRAQRAFEIMHGALFGRHHGVNSLHHLTMKLDYEQQLLARFFRRPAALRRRAREYIRRVNLDSAAFLDEIAFRAEDGLRRGEPAAEAVAAMADRVRTRTDEQVSEAADIIAQVRAARFDGAFPGERWTQRAASVGLAASLAIAVNDAGGQTQVFEMAPRPPPAEAPAPPPDEPSGDLVPEGNVDVVRNEFNRQALAILARHVKPAQDVQVVLLTDGTGRVRSCRVMKPGTVDAAGTGPDETARARIEALIAQLGAATFAEREAAMKALRAAAATAAPQLEEALRVQRDPEILERCRLLLAERKAGFNVENPAELTIRMRTLVFASPEARGRRFVIHVKKQELLVFQQGVIIDHPHICEMAPAPRD